VYTTIFYWFWFSISEGYHCGKHEVLEFPVTFDKITNENKKQLSAIADQLMDDLKNNSRSRQREQKTTNVEYQEFYPSKSKNLIDEIDCILARHYGLSEEELDFIINYDIKYRLGAEAEGEE
jgi:hypothetical protein